MLASGPGARGKFEAWTRRHSDWSTAHWVLGSVLIVPTTLFTWAALTDRGLAAGAVVAFGVWLVVLPFERWRHQRSDGHQPSWPQFSFGLAPAFVLIGAVVAAAADAPLIASLAAGALAGALYAGLVALVLRQLPDPDQP